MNCGNKGSLYHNAMFLSITAITVYYRYCYWFAGRNGPSVLEVKIIKKQSLI